MSQTLQLLLKVKVDGAVCKIQRDLFAEMIRSIHKYASTAEP